MKGIKGLKGRPPVGADLTQGRKTKRGVIEKDCLHIVLPYAADGVKALHPIFSSFNSAPVEARQSVAGYIVHASVDGCFEHHLKAQVLPGEKAHPNMSPACVGDGVHAQRWNGEQFLDIACPHEKCEYRQQPKPSCFPWMRFLFRLRWKEGSQLPTPLTRLTSKSWNTVAGFLGFFESIESTAKSLGIENPVLFGYPFRLQMVMKTKASIRARFSVLVITPDCDEVEFFMRQKLRLEQLHKTPSAPALTDPELQDPKVVYEDYQQITVPRERG